MMDGGDEGSLPVEQDVDVSVKRPPAAVDQDGKVVLATRLLVGLLTSGSGELFERLERLQDQIVLEAVRTPDDGSSMVDSSADLLRYVAIGLLLRSERSISRGIRGSANLALGMFRRSVGTLNRLTDNPIGRPLRRPLARRGRSWGERLVLLVREGQREEQISKLLAEEGAGVVIDAVVDVVADNPELDRLIGEVVGQKSKGLATIVGDNARTLTASGDDVAEDLLRRLLRRKPRQALPPSPLEGKPQTMYSTEALTEEAHDDH
jgi:hypothetical protein